MVTNVDITVVGGYAAMVSAFLSGLVTWLYIRKAKSDRGQSLTWPEKYIHPLIALLGTSSITFVSMLLMFAPQISTSWDLWMVGSVFAMPCSCFLVVGLMCIYLTRDLRL